MLGLPEKTALMLHADLRRCGIEPVDAQGRVVDTHSLRHGYLATENVVPGLQTAAPLLHRRFTDRFTKCSGSKVYRRSCNVTY